MWLRPSQGSRWISMYTWTILVNKLFFSPVDFSFITGGFSQEPRRIERNYFSFPQGKIIFFSPRGRGRDFFPPSQDLLFSSTIRDTWWKTRRPGSLEERWAHMVLKAAGCPGDGFRIGTDWNLSKRDGFDAYRQVRDRGMNFISLLILPSGNC